MVYCMHPASVFFALCVYDISRSVAVSIVLRSPEIQKALRLRSPTHQNRSPFTMGPLTFGDITTAIAFISVLGLIMTYDHITLIKQKLDALNTRLTGAIRQAEAAEAEARLAVEKYNISRKKIAMLEEKLNDYQRALMDEVAAITQRQDLSTAVVRRGGEKCHQGSLSRQLYEIPSASSRRTDTLSYISRKTTRGTILSKDIFTQQQAHPQQHAASVTATPRVADIVLGEMSQPQHVVVPRDNSDSGKSSVRSAFASFSAKIPWKLRTKEATAAVRRRMTSFHL